MSFLPVLSTHAAQKMQINEIYKNAPLKSLKVFETLVEIQQSAETYENMCKLMEP